ncbi:MAG: hypothetical protein DMG45_06395 [Acidobacteria bacterium]|nr:MAG: hypothetical protein DMG45_06395 [Acidobacteriota bacterium]
MELDTVDLAGGAFCPKLKGFYQVTSQDSILKICVSNIEKLNDFWVKMPPAALPGAAAHLRAGSSDAAVPTQRKEQHSHDPGTRI